MARLQRGRKHTEVQFEIGPLRELTRGDLAVLEVPRPAVTVKTLRDNHHRIARAIASGMNNAEVAACCGISISRVGSFKADPMGADLVAHYRAIVTAEWAQQDTVIEFMRSNALKAQAMLSDKLDAAAEAEEFLPTRDLVAISELGLDRTGYGKVQKNLNINVDFAAKLEAARRRSAEGVTPRLIDAHAIAGPPPQQSGPEPTHAPPLAPAQPSFRRRI